MVVNKNGLVGLSGRDAFEALEIRVEEGRIAEIGADLTVDGASDDSIVDASGCWVVPGGIDPQVHFYDPGHTQREDFAHGTSAAAAGGWGELVTPKKR